MKPLVNFANVSKQYQLGVTRTSLLTTISNSLKRVLKPGSRKVQDDRVLWALRNISFELNKGDSLAIIGRNGAGKSTTLKLLANITHPTSGQIDINGRLSALIELGSGFHPDLTGRENIYLNGTILGLSRSEIQRRYDEIVAFSEIERFIETPVKRYSSGMMVRLGFAVASCIEPDILVVDEVLAVGDTSFRQKCLQRIQSLIDKGTGIIFVSHNLYMVQSVCHSGLYLEGGQIKYSGDTQEVIDAYERDLHEERTRKYEQNRLERKNTFTDVQITKIDLLNMNGLNQVEFHGDQGMEIRIHYRTIGLARPANAVIRIIRNDGLTCCMIRTALDGVTLNLQEDQGTFSLILDELQLTGGTFFVDTRMTNESDNLVLAKGWSDWFSVSGISLSSGMQRGVYEPSRRWVEHPNPTKMIGVDGDNR